ncbi:hypothetical protein [Aquifex aeolicus]|uniref:hypothetical protein n=1 Tax=Aquifex aeolicus TaxID=63363 RepID=UPI0003195D32|nr:hypothetical protein [Aquifex aeolicus]
MKVLAVRNKRQKERVISRFLKKRKVVAVVNNPSQLKNDILKKADVVIYEEEDGKDSSN